MDSSAPLRVGLVGLGRFGQLHAAVLAALPEVQLAAIADPCAERLNQVGDRHAITSRFTDTWQGTIDAELAVVGTHRSAQLRLLDGPLQIWGEQRQHCPDALQKHQRQGRVQGALQEELRDFVTAARSGLPSATASLSDAIEGLRIAEAIVESGRSGQAVTLMPHGLPGGGRISPRPEGAMGAIQAGCSPVPLGRSA